MKKLAIVTTHPIQYNAPWFQLLAERQKIDLKVFYTWSQSEKSVIDRNFGKEISWDIPLLKDYNYEFVKNISNKPGSHHFFGIDCPELKKRIENYSPDTILVFGWNFKSHFNVMRHFKGKVPIWFRGDSTLLDETPGLKIRLRRQVLKFVYRYVDKALYVGSANKQYFKKHGLKDNQLIFAPHAIDNDRFMEDSKFNESVQVWRKELNLNANDIVVVFAGKLEPKKQPEFLLKAVQKANKSRKIPVKIVFVGSGSLDQSLKAAAGDDANINFLPFQNQSQMPAVYRLGNVLCLPSKGPGETWGLALNEAMASGTAIIATEKVGSVYDIIEDKGNGYIFAHDNLNELTNIIQSLEFSSLVEMGEKSRIKIQKWSFQNLVSNIENALINDD